MIPQQRESDRPASEPAGRLLQRAVAPAASLLAAGLAVGAALATGSEVGSINSGVDAVSGVWATAVGNVARVLPLGYAFGAGMVAAVNPCGFALLPAYLGLYLGTGSDETRFDAPHMRVRRALAVSLAMTAGFVVLFGITGLALSAAAATLARFFPWAGLGVGVLLLVAGGWLLSGGVLTTNLGEHWAGRVGARARTPGMRGYFAYGLAYGLASLSCTLPIFLTVVGSTLTAGGVAAGAFQLVLYGLGMGLVISLLTLSIAFFELAVVRNIRWALRWVQPASAAMLLLAGTYIIYYWLTLGGLLMHVGAA